MPKPDIVLVPGAWHSPEAFSLVTSRLQDAGYRVHTRQLPAVGNDSPPSDLSEDIAAVRALVTDAIADGNDVVVVPHSWGGIVVGSALAGWGKKQREAKGDKGGVVMLAYMTAFLVPESVSLMDALQHTLPDWIELKGAHSRALNPNIFYNDLLPEEQQEWFSKLQTHAYATFTAKTTAAAWKDIPTRYLVCEDDLAIPAVAQDFLVASANALGGDIQVERIKASHSPFLSQPDVVVNWIRRAAGESV